MPKAPSRRSTRKSVVCSAKQKTELVRSSATTGAHSTPSLASPSREGDDLGRRSRRHRQAEPTRDQWAAGGRGGIVGLAPSPGHINFGGHSVTDVRLLLVAYPGAGKGTQAAKLADRYRIAHLSSGELLRAEVTNGTKIGKVAADYLRRGDLVPDELVFEMLLAPVLEAVRSGGYVLDGFPRTLRQAEVAYSVAQEIEEH